jgi:dipeptidyl aminopeptidase/acylaminoacyl peptidase
MSKSEVVRWEVDGRTIEGVLTVPPESVARPPYALIVEPHGGPHSRTGRGSGFNAQIFAASGYAVLAPNFRGSAGYGQAFIDADRGDFGGGDMRDILSGIDELIRSGRVDPDRQFVYGVSYGGYMTSWLVGQTNRFRAAVAQNAVTDLDMMWGLSDLPSWVEWEFGGRPWEVPRVLRDHSPLTFASRVQTPTLVLNSREDRRCPMPMGLMFHRALLASGVETQMVVYPDEGHGIRQPRHRADVLRRTLAWFQAHDKK